MQYWNHIKSEVAKKGALKNIYFEKEKFNKERQKSGSMHSSSHTIDVNKPPLLTNNPSTRSGNQKYQVS